MDTKTPNILVYTGNNNTTLFNEICSNLQKCLRDDGYTVYHLLESEINEQPWMENSQLLIVSSEILENDIADVFETYLKKYGNILVICSNFNNSFISSECFQVSDKEALIPISFKEIKDVNIYRGKYSYDTNGVILSYDISKKPIIHKVVCNENVLILSEVYLDRDFAASSSSDVRLSILKRILSEEFGLEIKSSHIIPHHQLTPGYYIDKNKCESTERKALIETSEMPIFCEVKQNYCNAVLQLPIYFCKNWLSSLTFDASIYYSKLNSKVFGHQLIYFPVVTSTMDVAAQFSEYEGIVIVADCQISGRGRGSNKWISPKGCAMFTLHFTVKMNSKLGKRLTLLQHISSLAVVHGIRSQSAYKDLPLKIKWPNDINYGKTKVGGLLISSTIQNDTAHVSVGWGINVGNSYPTICLNDIIAEYNSKNSSSLPLLSVEEVIAHTLSRMEYFVTKVIEKGPEEIVSLYYSYWMHDNQEVTIKNSNEIGVVIGLDDFGFLKVQMNKEVLSLQPDGNRFDIMKNLIYSI